MSPSSEGDKIYQKLQYTFMHPFICKNLDAERDYEPFKTYFSYNNICPLFAASKRIKKRGKENVSSI